MPITRPAPAPRRPAPAPRRRAPDLGIVDGLVQTSFAVQAALAEEAAAHDLSIVQVRLLGVLRDREPRMAELAHALGLTRSSATGLIDRAQRRGLVARVTRPVGDERSVHVVATDAGRQLIEGIARRVDQRLSALVADLSAADQRRLSLLLTRVVMRDAALGGVDLGATDSTTTAGRPA